MSSSSITNQTTMEISFTTLAQAQEQEQPAINICGLPCVGDCATCVQSNADLAAFYAPAEIQMMAPAGDEEPEEDQTLEAARAMDAIEEAQRTGEAYEYDDEDDDYRGCHCMDCLNHDDPDYIPSYYYREDQDEGYGLDWNESGYFD